MKHSRWRRPAVFLEFLIFGVVIGVVEDVIAVWFVSKEPITLQVIGIIVLIAIPFAALGELVVDRIDFTPFLERIASKFRKQKKPLTHV